MAFNMEQFDEISDSIDHGSSSSIIGCIKLRELVLQQNYEYEKIISALLSEKFFGLEVDENILVESMRIWEGKG